MPDKQCAGEAAEQSSFKSVDCEDHISFATKKQDKKIQNKTSKLSW